MVGRTLRNVVLGLIVFIWVVPFVALLTTSFRSELASQTSGFWTAYTPTELGHRFSTHDKGDKVELTEMTGNIFDRLNKDETSFVIQGEVQSILFKGRVPDPDNPGKTKLIRKLVPSGEAMAVRDGFFVFESNGNFIWTFSEMTVPKPKNLEAIIKQNPVFGEEAYVEVLFKDKNVPNALISSFIVTIPATIIPITIAAFAAYAFAWMRFPGRQFLFVVVVGLLVVPLQMSLIPLLRMYNDIGAFFGVSGKSYPGIWLAHTGFGLPLAIYLLRNYMGTLPKEIIESARIDGANHFQIFTRLVVPLSVPALASFTILQFLWVWNDLLVALVFLGKSDDQIVLTSKMRELLGSRGDNWEILTSSAFISIVVPLIVFFALQRYFVRGLVAGSVKGG